LVLKNTKTAPNPKDPAKPSKTKYHIEEKAKNEALNRVKELLSCFPIYPELDLKLLKEIFCK
jgi:glycine hydroxymethyltransferase